MTTLQYRPIVDILADVVTDVRTEYDPAVVDPPHTSEKPYYMYGHPLEIVQTLAEKSGSSTYKYKKYPFIALFQDFDEQVGLSHRDVQLNLIIANLAKPEWKAAERYTNSFKEVLYPLWDLLMKHLARSPYVDQREFEYTKTDRLYWGKTMISGNEGNRVNDFVDAIEIRNLKLKIKDCKNRLL